MLIFNLLTSLDAHQISISASLLNLRAEMFRILTIAAAFECCNYNRESDSLYYVRLGLTVLYTHSECEDTLG